MTNIFLITLDAVRRDHLSCYGYSRQTTPNLDKLAKKYIKVAWCFTPASYTAASVPSILSAKYPTRTVTRFGVNLPYASSLRDLAPIIQLKKEGYRTAAFTSNPVTSSSINRTINLFFDYFSDTYSETKQQTPYKTSPELIDEVITYLRQYPDNNFIWIHLMDAHGPYVPYKISPFKGDQLWNKQKHLPQLTRIISDTFDGESVGDMLAKPGTQFYQLRDIVKDATGKIIDFQKDPRHYIAQYDLGIRIMDKSLGKLFEYLQSSKLWDDSTLAVHSDHGETMGENGLYFNHAYLTTPELALSPLIFKLTNHHKITCKTASAIDILPTLLDSKCISLPNGLDGHSLLAPIPQRYIYTIGSKDISIINPDERTFLSFHQGDLDYKAHKKPKDQLLPLSTNQPYNPVNFTNLYCFKYQYSKNKVVFTSNSYNEQDIILLEKCRLDLCHNPYTSNMRLNLSTAKIDNLIQILVGEDSHYATEARDSLAEYEKWVKILQNENEILKQEISLSLKLPKWISNLSSPTFRYWQKYCRLRDQLAPLTKSNHKGYVHKLNDLNIKKYILPSITFQAWYKTYRLRQGIRNLLPQSLKNQLKLLVSFFQTHPVEIDPRIMREWKNWNQVRPDASLDILNFGVISYDYRFQRPQQLAIALAKRHHRVFYIETEFAYALSAQVAKIKVRKAAPNVYVVTLSAPANYFIYRDTPSAKGVKIIMASLKILLRQARVINPVAKIDHPFWGALRDALGMPIVYDVMDLHEGFKESGKTILDKHHNLAQKSDLVLASSRYLKRTLNTETKNLILLKNAGEFTHFRTASRQATSCPSDLRGLPGPILGYYGALADWLDTSLIEATSRAFPSASLVLIGRMQNKELAKLAKKYKNIHLLGEKPYPDLPRYLSYFDVCLIPFKLTELILATDPVKIYEYFASGKPVVATPTPELKEYAKLMYFGSTNTQFCTAISHALAENTSQLRSARQLIASKNTWDMRALTLEQALLNQLYPKVSVVILVYNHADLSRISIDSTLKRSKYPNLELLAVDNKSDAETLKMLKTYKGAPNIKVVLNPENYGFAKGNNVGMKLASGEYIILLNNDVRVTPGWIERLVYHARHNPRVGLVGPVTNSIGNESKIEIEYDWDNAKEIECKSADYIYAHWGETLKLRNIAAFAWLSPRSVYKKLGGLDERFGRGLFEDDDYCMRVKKAKLDILVAEDAFVHHYGGASTNWGSPEFQLLFNTNKEKFENKWKTKWIPHQYRKGVK